MVEDWDYSVVSIGYPGPVLPRPADLRAIQSGARMGGLRFCRRISPPDFLDHTFSHLQRPCILAQFGSASVDRLHRRHLFLQHTFSRLQILCIPTQFGSARADRLYGRHFVTKGRLGGRNHFRLKC
jgi:hypothetical protein